MSPQQRRQKFAEANWYVLCRHVMHGTASDAHAELVEHVLELPTCAEDIRSGLATAHTADMISERVIRLSSEFSRQARQRRCLQQVMS